MLRTLAVQNYRSLLEVVVPLGALNVVTGANGSGKSNLYRSLQLLAQTAAGGVVSALAREGGLSSAMWAGPETITDAMRRGAAPIQGTLRKASPRIRLGFAGDDLGYAIATGYPIPPPQVVRHEPSKFSLDPEVKHECIWAGGAYRPSSALVERRGPLIRSREEREWAILSDHANAFDSMLSEYSRAAPELDAVGRSVRSWRFYDQFRTDQESLARLPQIGTRTEVVAQDGRDLAAALQTIREIGDREGLAAAVADAFEGAELDIRVDEGARFDLELKQRGLLRPLTAPELSDGTLRYLFLIAALLTPRPPTMMVLNEPETSLHPQLLAPLARLIAGASEQTQIWIVSHAQGLIRELVARPDCTHIQLEKDLGESKVRDQRLLDAPLWHWPDQ